MIKNEIFDILIKLKDSKDYFNIFFVGGLLDLIDDTLDLEGDEVLIFEELRKWVNEIDSQIGE